MIDEWNPNHPVVQQAHDHWHKFVAVMMVKFGLTELEIKSEDIERFAEMYPGGVVALDARGGRLVLRLMNEEEGRRVAKQEGGLPL